MEEEQVWVVTSRSTDLVLGTQLLALSALDSAKKRKKEVNSMEKLRDCNAEQESWLRVQIA